MKNSLYAIGSKRNLSWMIVVLLMAAGLIAMQFKFTVTEPAEIVSHLQLTSSSWTSEDDDEVMPLGTKMPEFELTDFRGREWSTDEFAEKKAIVVVFLGTECPLVRLYSSRLIEIQEQFAEQGVQVIGINSNIQDSMAELGAFARDTKVEFPLLKDPRNAVADQFLAKRTPEAFVFDGNQRLVYRGQIDDQYTYGRQRPTVGEKYVVSALKSSLAGNEVEVKETEPIGCIIGRTKIVSSDREPEVTYSQHISRILQDKCVSCHRPGEIAPFSLLDYEEVEGWADMIQEVVSERRMPPWHANPDHGEFSNDIRLSDEEMDLIARWVEEGAQEGDPALLPEPKQFVEGWQIGEPDDVITMGKVFQVPATGIVEYKYFKVPTNYKEDRWINAAEIRIGNRAVVHHVIVGLDREGRRAHGGVDSEWITACAPGSRPLQLPDGYAKLIPAGSSLVFQMHYTPNGTAQEDISSVGFKFVDADKVKKAVGTREVINTDFTIPAGANNFPVRARKTLRADSILLALFPHMHLRGKSFVYTAHLPDGSSEILLDVPNYDFNWQNSYVFAEPIRLPKGTVLKCVARYDNSEENIANPAPDEPVRWGDQTSEEMMIGYFDMALEHQDLTKQK